MQSNTQSQLHKSVYQLQGEDFEKRVGKYYEHLGYEVVYHGFEKGLKDGGIDLIVKKLSEKTKYVQCKNLKKQIDYDKIAGIYGRVVDELKFNVEFVIWANNGFDYGAKKFAEQKGILLMSGEDFISVEKEYTIVDVQDRSNNINWLCYDDVGSWSEGFVVVTQQNKQNWINEKGKLLSDIRFDKVGDFLEGVSLVINENQYNCVNKDGTLIFDKWKHEVGDWYNDLIYFDKKDSDTKADKNLDLYTDLGFDWIDDFSEGFARVSITEENWNNNFSSNYFISKYNFINKEGELLSDEWYSDVGEFSAGFARIQKNSKFNFIDTSGNLLSDTWFDGIETDEVMEKEGFNRVTDFSEGFAGVRGYFYCGNGQDSYYHAWNFITTNGTLLSKKWYDLVGNFSEGFAEVMIKIDNNNDETEDIDEEDSEKFIHNFINQYGKELSDIWFDGVRGFLEGCSVVELDDKYNLIDTKGKLLSETWFDYTSDFSEGYATVKIEGLGRNFIDTKGKLLF